MQSEEYQAERAVLGAILLSPTALDQVRSTLEAGQFAYYAHRDIYRAMVTLRDKDVPIDLITLMDQMRADETFVRAGGATYLSVLQEEVPSAANIKSYIQLVAQEDTKRKIQQKTAEIEKLTVSDDQLEALSAIEDLAGRTRTDLVRPSYWMLKEAVDEAFAHFAALEAHDGGITGVPSGLIDLDRITCGFQKAELIVIAARPGLGKTSLALQAAMHTAARHGTGVLFFSLEMARLPITQRMLCIEGRIDSNILRSGVDVGGETAAQLTVAAGAIGGLPILIDDSSDQTIDKIRALSRHAATQHDIGIVIIDYLQLMRGQRRDGRQQEIAEISRGLKALAKELNIPVLALAQLNRQSELRTDKRPVLADLRESGQIEQDADLVIFLYRDELVDPDTEDQGIAELIVAKHRNGPTGRVKVKFTPEWTRFDDLLWTAMEETEHG